MVGDNQALIINDGIRSKNENLNAQDTGSSGTAQSNQLMDLNSEDIENVSILKGAAATAVYGTAGSGGVIYGGNIDDWKLEAHGLLARYYLRVVNSTIALAEAKKSFSNSSQNMAYTPSCWKRRPLVWF